MILSEHVIALPPQKSMFPIPPREIHNEEQGSLEWMMLRQRYITASEAASILGVQKFGARNLREVLQIKRGEKTVKDNAAMSRGRRLEPVAREMAERELGMLFPPVVMTRGGLLASLDGWNEETETLLEIKCPFSESGVGSGIPDHYLPQLAVQAWVSGAKTVLYAVYWNGGLLVSRYDGADLRNWYLANCEVDLSAAVEHLRNGTSPPAEGPDEREDDAWLEASVEYQEALAVQKEAEALVESAKARLIALAGPDGAQGAGVSVSYVDRAGNVNWKAKPIVEALKAAGVDPEMYRGKATRYARVNVMKENGNDE